MFKVYFLVALAALQSCVQAANQYEQCGGQGWSGVTSCAGGTTCQVQNQYYSQCLPHGSGPALYGQCGGQGYSGSHVCPENSSCQVTNNYFSMCVPTGSGGTPVGGTPAGGQHSGGATYSTGGSKTSTNVKPKPKPKPNHKPAPKPNHKPAPKPNLKPAPKSEPKPHAKSASGDDTSPGGSGPTKVTPIGGAGGVKYAGVNIAGCDFGCSTDGSCTNGGSCPKDGAAQMAHFVKTDGFNLFRLPVGWQFLVNNQAGGPIGGAIAETYFQLVSDCLGSGPDVRCIIDIHNYARWNGQIVGQGGPTNQQFANLWTQFANKYAKESRIIFGVMNEPHDVEMGAWGETVQAVVTAIRGAGATSQVILLPGNGYTSAGGYPTSSGPTMSKITNPGGGTDGLIFDVHNYFDSDHSGTSTTCAGNGIDDAFSGLASYLKQNKRQAMLTEFGGGNNEGCVTAISAALKFLNSNSDVFAGWTSWAAGGFSADYELAQTPQGGQDTMLVAQALRPAVGGGAAKAKRDHARQWIN